MKNKIRLIDVSMLSSYMGKALTGVVTLVVIGIAVSALFDGGGIERNVIRVCVPRGDREGEAADAWEPFRSLLGRETRRPVVVTECSGEWPRGLDVYVMPVEEFFENETNLGVTALFEVGSEPDRVDKAVVITRGAEVTVDFSRVDPRDIAFADPRSVNGYWVQAEALERRGLALPGQAVLRFEGTRRDASRVIFGVIFGDYRFGACRFSEIASLSERGLVDPREVRTVILADALPEIVVAVGRGESAYFNRKIAALSRLLGDRGPVSTQGDTVRLLKALGVKSIEPLGAQRLERTRGLFERFGHPAAPPASVSP